MYLREEESGKEGEMEILQGDKVQGLKREREALLSVEERENGSRWNGDEGLRGVTNPLLSAV